MPEGGRLIIRTVADGENNMVDLVVRDFGVGMNTDQLQKIFQPYFSTKSGPDASGKGGTGLGLHACHKIILQHGGNITTLYAHMSKFAAKARIGSRVRQGQTIGYVGATGLATANHLHYEYRINGVHRNPRTVSLPKADPISEKYREQFLATAAPILEELEQFKSTQLATVAYLSD